MQILSDTITFSSRRQPFRDFRLTSLPPSFPIRCVNVLIRRFRAASISKDGRQNLFFLLRAPFMARWQWPEQDNRTACMCCIDPQLLHINSGYTRVFTCDQVWLKESVGRPGSGVGWNQPGCKWVQKPISRELTGYIEASVLLISCCR